MLHLCLAAVPPPDLLDDLERRAFQFFVDQSHPETGLTKDRAKNDPSGDAFTVASIASTGFALTAYAIGVERGWMARADAERRTERTLATLLSGVEHEHGWLYHFIDWKTGKREWKCEASTIDTTILLAGVLTAESYWAKSPAIRKACNDFRARIDWKWAMTDGDANPSETLIGHGYRPEEGFLKSRWSAQYSEEKMLYVFMAGSTDLPTSGWEKIGRKFETYRGIEFITGGPLFIHQMSEGWVDFRGMRDRLGIDYGVNTTRATLANRQYCIDNPKQFKAYGANFWGLSACDSPDGYRAFGAPGWIDDNGTITPTSAVASMPFTPRESRAFAEAMRREHPKAWGRYGFPNGYNPHRDWIDPEVIGIDLGMMMLGIENARSGMVHRWMARHPVVKRGLQRLGFRRTRETGPRPLRTTP
ncbi:MAG: glucoamylase family protein [Fimbriimonadaceae bacterium]|nr:glucoamylase family protein [Fimbriimonadaceae bacterium]